MVDYYSDSFLSCIGIRFTGGWFGVAGLMTILPFLNDGVWYGCVSLGVFLGVEAILDVFFLSKREKFLCPYCFKISKIKEAQIQCINPQCKEGRPFIQGKKIQRDRHGIPVSAKCSCGHVSNKVVCPHCHNHLPESTLTGDNVIISVIRHREDALYRCPDQWIDWAYGY